MLFAKRDNEAKSKNIVLFAYINKIPPSACNNQKMQGENLALPGVFELIIRFKAP